MHELTNTIINILSQNTDAEYANQMSAYMRNKFPFLGIRSPVKKELLKPYLTKTFINSTEDIEKVILELWELDEREYQHTACTILQKISNNLEKEYIKTFEYLITTKSWWDSVDSLVPSSLGKHFKNYPELIEPYVDKWIKSENIWLQRSCVLFQLKYKYDTDLELLYRIISRLKDSDEFFVQKAIGWILREYSKINPTEIINYISSHDLKALSSREALKYLKNKGVID